MPRRKRISKQRVWTYISCLERDVCNPTLAIAAESTTSSDDFLRACLPHPYYSVSARDTTKWCSTSPMHPEFDSSKWTEEQGRRALNASRAYAANAACPGSLIPCCDATCKCITLPDSPCCDQRCSVSKIPGPVSFL